MNLGNELYDDVNFFFSRNLKGLSLSRMLWRDSKPKGETRTHSLDVKVTNRIISNVGNITHLEQALLMSMMRSASDAIVATNSRI